MQKTLKNMGLDEVMRVFVQIRERSTRKDKICPKSKEKRKKKPDSQGIQKMNKNFKITISMLKELKNEIQNFVIKLKIIKTSGNIITRQ